MTAPVAPHIIEGVVGESHVFVDVSDLARVGFGAAWCFVAVGVAVIAVVAAAVAASPRLRPALGLAIVCAAVGAAVCATAAAVHGVHLAPYITGVAWALRQGDGAVIAAGAAIGAAVVAVIIAVIAVAFASAKDRLDGDAVVVRRRVAGAVAIAVGGAAVVVGVVGVVKIKAVREHSASALRAVWPLPVAVFPGQGEGAGPLPEVHVGRSRRQAPEAVWTHDLYGIAQTPHAQSASASWWPAASLTTTLKADAPGEHTATMSATAGLVRLSQELRFKAVEDRGPVGMALRPGHRQAWVEVNGRGGVVAQTAKRLRTQRAKPSPDVVMVVLDERDDNGLRTMRLQLADGSGTRVIDAVQKDGVLARVGGGVLIAENAGGCDVPLLGFSSCTCTTSGVASCADRSSNTVGSIVRMSLAVFTLGLSDITGACRNSDATTERVLVLLP